MNQPATGGWRGGRDALDGEVIVEVWESGMGQDEGRGVRELGRPAVTERRGGLGEGVGAGWTSQTSGAEMMREDRDEELGKKGCSSAR